MADFVIRRRDPSWITGKFLILTRFVLLLEVRGCLLQTNYLAVVVR